MPPLRAWMQQPLHPSHQHCLPPPPVVLCMQPQLSALRFMLGSGLLQCYQKSPSKELKSQQQDLLTSWLIGAATLEPQGLWPQHWFPYRSLQAASVWWGTGLARSKGQLRGVIDVIKYLSLLYHRIHFYIFSFCPWFFRGWMWQEHFQKHQSGLIAWPAQCYLCFARSKKMLPGQPLSCRLSHGRQRFWKCKGVPGAWTGVEPLSLPPMWQS